ncbi:MAG: UDPGP type 1 family protein [Phycisphaerae bacterium]|jgi:UDP-N-acetylglucosamine/UDP-N-acetylgalactosamine diphosphorylase
MSADPVAQRWERYRRVLADYRQDHLLRFWPELSPTDRTALLDDLDQVDFERCAPLVETLVRRRPPVHVPERIEPPACLPAAPSGKLIDRYAEARVCGEQAIAEGRVAAFTVAGGQGTRLGYDGPKGAFRITPVRDASLFQWFAEYLRGVRRRYGRTAPWYIMTSPSNHTATVRFFEQHGHFGLDPGQFMFFQQGQMPAFQRDGRIAMTARHRLALSPDGHGGSLSALRKSGALDDMRRRGVEYISYFQVDNPLVRCVDPVFIGLHVRGGSEMSSKAVAKAHDFEKVGVFADLDGRLGVLEYSDLPETLATARNPDGTRRFDAGSIAIHVLSRGFVERLTQPGSGIELGWHRADKKVAIIDERGQLTEPREPNVVKLELFVFDAIPLARNPLVLFTRREEEFSPVKNADGVDSPATARRDLVRRAARWFEACGLAVPRAPDGEPAVPIEISPAVALDAEDLRGRRSELASLDFRAPVLLA